MSSPMLPIIIEPEIECEKCLQRFASETQLDSHMREEHDESPFRCDFCQKSFKYGSTLRGHNIDVHHGIRVCNSCGKGFSNSSILARHVREEHNGEKQSSNEISTKRKKFECEACGKGFANESFLFTHIRGHHLGIKYVCEVCGVKYIHRSSYSKHIKTEH